MIETVINDRRSSHIGEKNMSHFPFRGSPTTQNSSAPSSPPSSLLSQEISTNNTNSTTNSLSMAVTTTITVPPGARSSSPYSQTSSGQPQQTSTTPTSNQTQQQQQQQQQPKRCCETGRLIYTDQVSGRSICSCEIETLNNQLANSAGIPPGMGFMPSPYGERIPYFTGFGSDQLPFYSNMAGGLELKENLAAGGVPWPYPTVPYYESALGGYAFNPYGMELNGARRKNATRETTSMLKAWLNDHKKNPYPTKGEKIMLAIVTKMTLTQVSTWFANARRRLKKENKMTWEPRNRVDDDDATIDDDDHKSNDGKDLLDSKDSGTGSSEDGDRPPHHRLDLMDHHLHHMPPHHGLDLKSGWHDSRNSPDICDRNRPPHPLLHPAALHHLRPMTGSPPDPKHTPSGSTNSNDINKPRIWSLADMAKKENNNKEIEIQPSQSGLYPPGPGKIISPLAGRYPMHPSPYMKPEFYRSLYSPNPAHITGNPHDHQALLESYHSFGSSLAHNRLAGLNPLVGMKPGHPLTHPLAPLNLPPNHLSSTTPPSGISPSASSTTSSGPEITSPSSHNNNNNNNHEKNSSPISVTRP